MAIKIEELRVGVWVRPLTSGVVTQVSLFMLGEIAADETYLDYLMPVPLSPELLEKAGFEKTNGEIESWKIPIGKDNYIEWHDDNSVLIGDYTGYSTVMIVVENISSLHQLQNLYYSLTGNELEINLQPS